MRRRRGAWLALLGAGACAPSPPAPSPPAPPPQSFAAPLPLPFPPPPPPSSPAAGAAARAQDPLAVAPPPRPADPEAISPESAEALLFLEVAGVTPGVAACRAATDAAARVRCLLGARFAGDEAARALALGLYDDAGDVAGVEAEQQMDGGFRGTIHLVPEPPVGPLRRHLAWVAGAARDFDLFFTGLARGGVAPPRYRFKKLAWRFFRSEHRTTPSAYAQGWAVAYNVAGSLNTSADAVRETLFHEVFHLNDAAHGDWSARALGPTFDAIVGRCGTRLSCLAPYAPGSTVVRGGTYYAFQPGNGEAVHEYAAELASRFYRENRLALRGKRPAGPPFKCGPPENRVAWDALVAEFFAGLDRVPPCGS